jgi:hypothetical protein
MVEDGSAIISTNATDWSTAAPVAVNTYYEAMAFGNGAFVAVGDNGIVATTTNGLTWSTGTPVGTNVNFFDIIFGPIGFVAVTFDGHFVSSPDGKEWSVQNTGDLPELAAIQSLAFGNGLYLITGRGTPPDYTVIYSSPDLISWTAGNAGTTNFLYDIAAGDGKFAAVGADGGIVSSSDGRVWTPRPSSATASLFSIVRAHGQFCAVGSGGSAFTSADGVVWEPHGLGVAGLMLGVTADQESFLAVGSSGRIRQSPQIVQEVLPILKISRAGDEAVISWALPLVGFTLEERRNLSLADWNTVSIPVVDTATEHTVTLPITGTNFFRLKR